MNPLPSLAVFPGHEANRLARFVVFALFGIGLVVPQVLSAQLAPPLLEVHGSRLNAAGPLDLETIEETLYLGRDGKTEIRSVRRDIQAEGRFVVTTIRGAARTARLARVRAALGAADPLSFPARCVGRPVSLGSDYGIDLSWFSRDGRLAKVTVSLQGPTTCRPEILELLDEIDALALAVTTAAGTTIESGTCTTDRQCPRGLLCCASGGVPQSPRLCLAPIPLFEGCPLFP